MSLLVLDNEH